MFYPKIKKGKIHHRDHKKQKEHGFMVPLDGILPTNDTNYTKGESLAEKMRKSHKKEFLSGNGCFIYYFVSQ